MKCSALFSSSKGAGFRPFGHHHHDRMIKSHGFRYGHHGRHGKHSLLGKHHGKFGRVFGFYGKHFCGGKHHGKFEKSQFKNRGIGKFNHFHGKLHYGHLDETHMRCHCEHQHRHDEHPHHHESHSGGYDETNHDESHSGGYGKHPDKAHHDESHNKDGSHYSGDQLRHHGEHFEHRRHHGEHHFDHRRHHGEHHFDRRPHHGEHHVDHRLPHGGHHFDHHRHHRGHHFGHKRHHGGLDKGCHDWYLEESEQGDDHCSKFKHGHHGSFYKRKQASAEKRHSADSGEQPNANDPQVSGDKTNHEKHHCVFGKLTRRFHGKFRHSRCGKFKQWCDLYSSDEEINQQKEQPRASGQDQLLRVEKYPIEVLLSVPEEESQPEREQPIEEMQLSETEREQ